MGLSVSHQPQLVLSRSLLFPEGGTSLPVMTWSGPPGKNNRWVSSPKKEPREWCEGRDEPLCSLQLQLQAPFPPPLSLVFWCLLLGRGSPGTTGKVRPVPPRAPGRGAGPHSPALCPPRASSCFSLPLPRGPLSPSQPRIVWLCRGQTVCPDAQGHLLPVPQGRKAIIS